MEMKGLPDEPTLFIWTYLNVREIHCLRCTGRYTVRIQFLLLPLSYETSTSSPTQNTVFQSIFKTIFKERYPSFGDRVELDLKFMHRCERAILYSPVEWSQGPYVFFNSTFILHAHLRNSRTTGPWTVSQRRNDGESLKEVRVCIHHIRTEQIKLYVSMSTKRSIVLLSTRMGTKKE